MAGTEELIDELAGLALFADLGRPELAGIAHTLDEEWYADGQRILRDAFRQSLVGGAAVVLFEFLLRLDLSRSFLGMFVVVAWMLLCLFRLNAGRMLGLVRREFGAPNYILVVGLGEPALRIGRQIEAAAAYGVRLSGFLSDQNGSAPERIQLGESYPVKPLADVPDLADQVWHGTPALTRRASVPRS
jgi:hypothetical protein